MMTKLTEYVVASEWSFVAIYNWNCCVAGSAGVSTESQVRPVA